MDTDLVDANTLYYFAGPGYKIRQREAWVCPDRALISDSMEPIDSFKYPVIIAIMSLNSSYYMVSTWTQGKRLGRAQG
jgi:hypothetical protein